MKQVIGPGALGRPRGIGWRGRWEGGLGWGIHVTPWLIHVNVWQDPLKCCEVISLQLIKINEKKKNKIKSFLFPSWNRWVTPHFKLLTLTLTALCPLPWEISHGTAVFSLSFPVTENMFSCFLSKVKWFVLAVLFVCNALFLITVWLVLWHSGKRILFRVKYGLSRWNSW